MCADSAESFSPPVRGIESSLPVTKPGVLIAVDQSAHIPRYRAAIRARYQLASHPLELGWYFVDSLDAKPGHRSSPALPNSLSFRLATLISVRHQGGWRHLGLYPPLGMACNLARAALAMKRNFATHREARMKIFVTGGNGFIGSSVVRMLIEEMHEVKCLVRTTSNTDRLDGLEWERFVGDVRDKKSLAEGMSDCDAVVHLASPSSWDDIISPDMQDIVEGGTRNILDAALEQGNKRVVYCSSIIGINGTELPEMIDEDSEFTITDPRMVYAHSKNEAENICHGYVENHDSDVVIINPAEVYGPNDHDFVTAGNLVDFATSWPVLVSRGGTSITHVEDVALGTVRALERGRSGERYILGGDNLTIRELAEKTCKILDKSAPIVTVPTGVLKGLTRVGVAMHIPLPYNPNVIPYATKYWFVDNSKARDELGIDFRPAEEVLRPTIDWLKESGHL